jgi:hypothetical protein
MNLALTLDYELYGDGSGNVFRDVIDPTEIILSVLRKYNIKATIFIEIAEYWKLREEWDKGNKMGYIEDPALNMKKQIVNAFKEGHDVQLHIHPQWLNAIYDKKWILDSNWCMKDIPLEKVDESGYDLYSVIKRGKDTLEDWFKPIQNDYQCNIFRAGAFNILPSERILPVLKKLDFVTDSSTYAGGYEINELSNIDYTSIKNDRPYWSCIKNNVLNQGDTIKPNDFLEIPIFSSPVNRIFKYNIFRLKALLRHMSSSFGTIKNRLRNKTLNQKFSFFFEKEHITWDYCLFNVSRFMTFYDRAQKIENNSRYDYHPFVLIGHSKSFYNKKTLEEILKRTVNKDNFITMTDIVTTIYARSRES